MVAWSESDEAVVASGDNAGGAEGQGGDPGRSFVGFIENLVARAEGCVHQAGGFLDAGVWVEGTPADSGAAEFDVKSPLFGDAVIEGEIALADINAVALAVGRVDRDILALVFFPDVIRLGLLVEHTGTQLALGGHVGPLGEGKARGVFGGER